MPAKSGFQFFCKHNIFKMLIISYTRNKFNKTFMGMLKLPPHQILHTYYGMPSQSDNQLKCLQLN